MLLRMGLHTPPCGAPLSVSCQRHSSRVSCLEHVSDEPQEPIVLDMFAEDVQKDIVIESSEAIRNVAFNHPVNTLPGMHNLAESSMASPSRSRIHANDR